MQPTDIETQRLSTQLHTVETYVTARSQWVDILQSQVPGRFHYRAHRVVDQHMEWKYFETKDEAILWCNKAHQERDVVDEVLEVLNSAFNADPSAIHALVENRVPCNAELADHPHIPVDTNLHSDVVGVMGMINGILSALSVNRVAAMWSEPDAHGRCKLLGFVGYKAPTAANKA